VDLRWQRAAIAVELVSAKFRGFCLGSRVSAASSQPTGAFHCKNNHRPRASAASKNNFCCSPPSEISITTTRDPIPAHIELPWQVVLCARRSIVSLVTPPGKAREQADSGIGHVFGKPTRKEACYDNLHISRNAWDTNLVKV
jgi:hypothetical protein